MGLARRQRQHGVHDGERNCRLLIAEDFRKQGRLARINHTFGERYANIAQNPVKQQPFANEERGPLRRDSQPDCHLARGLSLDLDPALTAVNNPRREPLLQLSCGGSLVRRSLRLYSIPGRDELEEILRRHSLQRRSSSLCEWQSTTRGQRTFVGVRGGRVRCTVRGRCRVRGRRVVRRRRVVGRRSAVKEWRAAGGWCGAGFSCVVA